MRGKGSYVFLDIIDQSVTPTRPPRNAMNCEAKIILPTALDALFAKSKRYNPEFAMMK